VIGFSAHKRADNQVHVKGDSGTTSPRLNSWKEVANYLGRDVRTVIRWEKDRGLPVHRVPGGKRQSLYAYPDEIDNWMRGNVSELTTPPVFVVVEEPEPSDSLGAPRRWKKLRKALVAAGVLSCVCAFGFYFWTDRSRPDQLSFDAGSRAVPFTTSEGLELYPAISPDGTELAYVASGSSNLQELSLYVKPISGGREVRLTSEPGQLNSPAWSPDSQRIAFAREQSDSSFQICIAQVRGGSEVVVATITGFFGGLDWSPAGSVLVVSYWIKDEQPFRLVLMDLDSHSSRQITFPDTGTYGDHAPHFSRDGMSLAFLRSSSYLSDFLYIVPSSGGAARQITSTAAWITGLSWTEKKDELLFSAEPLGESGLWTVSTTSRRVHRLTTFSAASPTISRDGSRLFCTQQRSSSRIYRIGLNAPNSNPEKLISSTQVDRLPQYSPDGKKIAFESTRSGTREIWVADASGENAVQLTHFGGPWTGSPRWSPDGLQIAFDSRPSGNGDIFAISAFGGSPRQLTFRASNEVIPSWSADGKWIYFGSDENGTWQIWKVPASGGSPVQFTHNGGYMGVVSTDGAWFYFTKDHQAGIWRVPSGGGKEEKVIENLSGRDWSLWGLHENKIIFLDRHASANASIVGYDVQSRRGTGPYFVFQHSPGFDLGLTVSPDGRWLAYGEDEETGSDIVMVEHFRK
jgi:Tol biopolymer transport system component